MAGPSESKTGEDHTIVVVGAGGVGKSCITVRFLKDEFTSDYDPTVEENYRKVVNVDNVSCVLNIVDTAGQQEFTALRDQHLVTGEGFLLVYAINDKNTFQEAIQLRESVINLKDTSKVPFILVGNKCDMEDAREVTKEELKTTAEGLNIPFIETSAKSNINVQDCFYELVKEVRKIKQVNKTVPKKDSNPSSGSCCVLL